MITMTAWPLPRSTQDRATCSWDGRPFEATAFSATTELARKLVAAGCPDQPWESRTQDGTRSLYGPSLHNWANRVVTQDRGRLIQVRWRPHHRA